MRSVEKYLNLLQYMHMYVHKIEHMHPNWLKRKYMYKANGPNVIPKINNFT